MTIRRCAAALAIAAASFSGPANAAMVSFFLDQSNVSVLPDGNNYLKLTIWDGSDAIGRIVNGYTAVSGDVVFEVQTLPALSQYAQNKFGLDTFAFNTKMNLNMYAVPNFMGLPSNWSIGIGGQNADGFGEFELTPGTHGANNVVDPLFFVISGIAGDSVGTYQDASSGNAGQGNYDFASHVINFAIPGDNTNTTSAWFGGNTPTVVPLPAAGWLLLSGLGAGAFIRRRRRAQAIA
jgi:hypothetical protein